MALHETPYFLFPNVLKRWSFIWKDGIIKKDRWYFFFPKISSYSLDGKWKIIFPKKYMGIWYFLQIIWKDGLSKKIALEYNLSCCIVWKDGISFSPKILSYLKMKYDLSQKIHGNMTFSVCMYKCYKYDITVLQKKSKLIFSRKNTLKVNKSVYIA